MAGQFEKGAVVVCTHDELYNAFGEGSGVLFKGAVGEVRDSMNFFGVIFIEFEEYRDKYFQSSCFKRKLDG